MRFLLGILTAMCLLCVGCSDQEVGPEVSGDVGVHKELTKIGFSQLGAESDWRLANTASVKETFTREAGYQLIYEDAGQKQANQTMAIRRFIQQGVDYIIVAPATEKGWENVLGEAKKAGIPVVLVDRLIEVKDQSLYTCWVGSDFRLEADKVTSWMEQYFKLHNIKQKKLRIAHLQGSQGASAQIGRTEGLNAAVKRNNWKVVASEDGDFTQAKGREVTAQILEEHSDVNVIYSENDEMAMGAIEAIEAAGKKAGKDIEAGEIMVVSFDGVSDEAMRLLWEGKISCIGECYPMHGPKLRAAIDMLEAGEKPDKLSYVSEGIYSADTTITQVSVDGKDYPVTIVTDSWLKARE